MRFHAKLLVRDEQVLCPKSGDWRGVAECARCAELIRMPDADATGRRTVECRPDVDHPVRALHRMMRG